MAEKKDKVEEEVAEEKMLCGHINKQHKAIGGKLEDLACILPIGHDGDHFATHLALRKVDDNFETAQAVADGAKTYTMGGIMYAILPAESYWSDSASIPAANIVPDLEQLAELKRSKRKLVE